MAKVVVFPCCAGKENKYWKNNEGKPVVFVAHADLNQCGESSEFLYSHPDDVNRDTGKVWRQELEDYNKQYQLTGKNPLHLCRAWELYKPKWPYEGIYKTINQNPETTLFILSAGWGLVNSDFLLPYYDITLAREADGLRKRDKNDEYKDFNHLALSIGYDDSIFFPGLTNYLGLFRRLTRGFSCTKIVYYYAGKETSRKDAYRELDYEFRPYEKSKNSRTWHYAWAIHLTNGKLTS